MRERQEEKKEEEGGRREGYGTVEKNTGDGDTEKENKRLRQLVDRNPPKKGGRGERTWSENVHTSSKKGNEKGVTQKRETDTNRDDKKEEEKDEEKRT